MRACSICSNAKFFKGASREAFSEQAGHIIGGVNYVHPFREGNGRTQLLYLEQQLAAIAGHTLDLRRIDASGWIEASKRAHNAGYGQMGRIIFAALAPGRKKS